MVIDSSTLFLIGSNDRKLSRRIKFKRKITHPKYKPDPIQGSIVYDVALVELGNSIIYQLGCRLYFLLQLTNLNITETPIDWSEFPLIREGARGKVKIGELHENISLLKNYYFKMFVLTLL